jgi:hypothetical protein
MAHFAKLDENNNVLAVHVVANEEITINGIESEQAGIDFLTNLYGHTHWKQCSYNGNLRKNYPSAGVSIYNPERDAFMDKQPYPSWILDEDSCTWHPPVEKPKDEFSYSWDEATTSWVKNPVYTPKD